MKEIELTQGAVAIVDDEDYEYLSKIKWHLQIVHDCRYAVDHKQKLMHRLIMNPQKGYETDHKDGNGLNNCKSNLRLATHRQNICNRRTQLHSSRFRGVRWDKRENRWMAQIRVWGEAIYLGSFHDELEAAEVYKQAAIKHQGEFARPTLLTTGD